MLGQVKGAGTVGDAGEDQEADEGDGDGKDAVDDEQPAPPGHAGDAREVGVGGRLQVPADHGPQRVADEPGARAPKELVAAVPGAQDKVRAGEDGGFKHADHFSSGGARVLGGGHKSVDARLSL